ncbi:antitoxin MazE family protein [Caballeronia mineralivorans]|nr:antitoxin MazE family protein [Caballeronia mineralivorans]
MMAATLSERVRAHRQNLRAAGLRPIQIWVPDTRRPGFAEECARQSRVIRESHAEADLLDFIEQIADIDDLR